MKEFEKDGVKVSFDPKTNKFKVSMTKEVELELWENSFENDKEVQETLEEVANELDEQFVDYIEELKEEFEISDEDEE